MKRKNAIERLLRKVKVNEKTDCWEFMGARHEKGYGLLSINGKCTRAHRFAYSVMVGDIPPGLHVLHECDNPCCVAPLHLKVGTNQDNMDDRSKRGRTAVGERAGNSKLTYMMVKFIRARDDSNVECARIYGVSRKTIADIRNRRTWKHIEG